MLAVSEDRESGHVLIRLHIKRKQIQGEIDHEQQSLAKTSVENSTTSMSSISRSREAKEHTQRKRASIMLYYISQNIR